MLISSVIEDRKDSNNYSLIIDGCPDLNPDFSIMIPTFRRPDLVVDAIYSAINQSSRYLIEVVVVDNDDEDEYYNEMLEIIENFSYGNIRYYKNCENIGMFNNWNRCIDLARGKWITILNDDDMLMKNFVEVVMRYSSLGGLLCSDFYYTKSEGPLRYKMFSEASVSCSDFKVLNLSDLFWKNPVNGSLGAAFEKKKAIEIGGFDDSWYPTSDYHFTFRYWERYGVVKLKSKLAIYRWGRNETMKAETLYGFLRNDKKMRIDILESYLSRRTLLRSVYIKIVDYILVRSINYYATLNSDFSIEKALEQNGVKKNKLSKWLFFPVFVLIVKLLVKGLDYVSEKDLLRKV